MKAPPDKRTRTCECDFRDSHPRPKPRAFSSARACAAPSSAANSDLGSLLSTQEPCVCLASDPPTALPLQVRLFPWTDKETEAQRHEATCRDQQQGCAGARVCSTRLTPKGFKAWAFSRFCSQDAKFLSLAFEPPDGPTQDSTTASWRGWRVGGPRVGADRGGLTGKESQLECEAQTGHSVEL